MKRPEKDIYFMNIAREVSRRSTCLRRRFGAVIVKADVILSTGYVGAPRGTPNCIDLKKCARTELNISVGERYELCRSVHAEMNAIINAARSGVAIVDSKMYLYVENVKDNKVMVGKPCKLCRRMIVNAGIKEVVVISENNKLRRYAASYWVKESKKDPFKELKEKGY